MMHQWVMTFLKKKKEELAVNRTENTTRAKKEERRGRIGLYKKKKH